MHVHLISWSGRGVCVLFQIQSVVTTAELQIVTSSVNIVYVPYPNPISCYNCTDAYTQLIVTSSITIVSDSIRCCNCTGINSDVIFNNSLFMFQIQSVVTIVQVQIVTSSITIVSLCFRFNRLLQLYRYK